MNDDGYLCGNFPVRTELTVLPADDPYRGNSKLHRLVINAKGKCGLRKPFTLGWSVKESIGIAIVNPRAIKALSKPVIVGK